MSDGLITGGIALDKFLSTAGLSSGSVLGGLTSLMPAAALGLGAFSIVNLIDSLQYANDLERYKDRMADVNDVLDQLARVEKQSFNGDVGAYNNYTQNLRTLRTALDAAMNVDINQRNMLNEIPNNQTLIDAAAAINNALVNAEINQDSFYFSEYVLTPAEYAEKTRAELQSLAKQIGAEYNEIVNEIDPAAQIAKLNGYDYIYKKALETINGIISSESYSGGKNYGNVENTDIISEALLNKAYDEQASLQDELTNYQPYDFSGGAVTNTTSNNTSSTGYDFSGSGNQTYTNDINNTGFDSSERYFNLKTQLDVVNDTISYLEDVLKNNSNNSSGKLKTGIEKTGGIDKIHSGYYTNPIPVQIEKDQPPTIPGILETNDNNTPENPEDKEEEDNNDKIDLPDLPETTQTIIPSLYQQQSIAAQFNNENNNSINPFFNITKNSNTGNNNSSYLVEEAKNINSDSNITGDKAMSESSSNDLLYGGVSLTNLISSLLGGDETVTQTQTGTATSQTQGLLGQFDNTNTNTVSPVFDIGINETFTPTNTFNPTYTPTVSPVFDIGINETFTPTNTFNPTYTPTFNPTNTFNPTYEPTNTFNPTFNPTNTFNPTVDTSNSNIFSPVTASITPSNSQMMSGIPTINGYTFTPAQPGSSTSWLEMMQGWL